MRLAKYTLISQWARPILQRLMVKYNSITNPAVYLAMYQLSVELVPVCHKVIADDVAVDFLTLDVKLVFGL